MLINAFCLESASTFKAYAPMALRSSSPAAAASRCSCLITSFARRSTSRVLSSAHLVPSHTSHFPHGSQYLSLSPWRATRRSAFPQSVSRKPRGFFWACASLGFPPPSTTVNFFLLAPRPWTVPLRLRGSPPRSVNFCGVCNGPVNSDSPVSALSGGSIPLLPHQPPDCRKSRFILARVLAGPESQHGAQSKVGLRM